MPYFDYLYNIYNANAKRPNGICALLFTALHKMTFCAIFSNVLAGVAELADARDLKSRG